MSSSEIILALSNLFWAYAVILTATWFRQVAQTDRRDHVGHFMGLMGVFVPGVALTLIMLLAGAMFSLPAMVAILVIAFPASIAFGLHLEVTRLGPSDVWTDARRGLLAVLLAILLTGSALEV
ncbi:MAG: hypothetical protein AAFW64_00340 [Pseudomonadota bacterium]